jgi:hypothetical protein
MILKLPLLVLLLLSTTKLSAQSKRDQAQQLAVESHISGVTVSLYLRAAELTSSGKVRALGKLVDVNQSSSHKLKMGRFIVVCFNANAAGFVTLWVKAADQGHATLILPNAFSNHTRAQRIEANREICVGDERADFRFRVDKPLGQYELLVHWTENLNDAIAEDAYADLSRAVTHSLDDPGVTSRLSYEVEE